MELPKILPAKWVASGFYWSVELGYFESKIWVTHVLDNF